MKKLLQDRLDQFVALYEDGPKQGSEEWLSLRQFSIGGSEMASLQGKNPFSNLRDLIAGKIGLIPRRSGVQMLWGKLFEPVIKEYVEQMMNTNISGSDLFIPGRVPHQTYSPDGLGVIEFEKEVEREVVVPDPLGRAAANKMRIETSKVSSDVIALFEFKCPYSRIPHGEVPDYYLPQVKAGLDTIEITDIGVFIEGIFRRCMFHDLGMSAIYDKGLTLRDPIKLAGRPFAYGFVIFYGTEDLPFQEEYDAAGYELANDDLEISDFGDMDPKMFEKLMFCFEKKVVSAYYSPIWYDEEDPRATLESITSQLLSIGTRVYGMMAWKLFRVDTNYVEKEIGYLDKWQKKIEEVISVVKSCKADPNNQLHILSSYFSTGRMSGTVHE